MSAREQRRLLRVLERLDTTTPVLPGKQPLHTAPLIDQLLEKFLSINTELSPEGVGEAPSRTEKNERCTSEKGIPLKSSEDSEQSYSQSFTHNVKLSILSNWGHAGKLTLQIQNQNKLLPGRLLW